LVSALEDDFSTAIAAISLKKKRFVQRCMKVMGTKAKREDKHETEITKIFLNMGKFLGTLSNVLY
jgi:hypothetical protein